MKIHHDNSPCPKTFGKEHEYVAVSKGSSSSSGERDQEHNKENVLKNIQVQEFSAEYEERKKSTIKKVQDK